MNVHVLGRTFVSSESAHCPLLNLSCDGFNYTDSLRLYRCHGNKGVEIRILSSMLCVFVDK